MSDELKLKMIEALTKGHLKVGQLIFEVKGNNYYYEDRSREENKQDIAPGVLSKAISEVQPFFWVSVPMQFSFACAGIVLIIPII